MRRYAGAMLIFIFTYATLMLRRFYYLLRAHLLACHMSYMPLLRYAAAFDAAADYAMLLRERCCCRLPLAFRCVTPPRR